MLRKLFKYEVKSISRVFIPMWILTPVVALLLSASIRSMSLWTENFLSSTFMVAGSGILLMIMSLLFFGIIVGLFVMTILFIIQRFWNGLLKEEGYLMFTLPVKTWQLVVSKAITATVVSCIGIIVGIFSCMILAVFSTSEIIESLAYVWKYAFRDILKIGPEFWFYLLLSLLLLVAGIVGSIYHVYVAMAVGQLWQDHKVLGSCLSFVGISIIVSILTNIVEYIVYGFGVFEWSYVAGNPINTWYLLFTLLIQIIQIMIYHVITERLLATRLNLE